MTVMMLICATLCVFSAFATGHSIYADMPYFVWACNTLIFGLNTATFSILRRSRAVRADLADMRDKYRQLSAAWEAERASWRAARAGQQLKVGDRIHVDGKPAFTVTEVHADLTEAEWQDLADNPEATWFERQQANEWLELNRRIKGETP